jgi:hypothetical protein
MNKYSLFRKGLAVSVILFFIGLAIAPSINFNIVKASHDNDLVEVTTQACGIQGYGDATVELTREQYTEVEKLFEDIEVKLKTVKTREEALPIYNNAIRELNTYGLLPKGMSVEQVQKLVVDGYSTAHGYTIFEEISHKNRLQEYHDNFCCLVAGVVQDGSAQGIVGMIVFIFLMLSIFPSLFHINTVLAGLIGLILTGISYIIVTFSPLAIMQQININSGNMILFGLDGLVHFNEGLLNGFNGIKITRIDTKEMYLLGFSLMVSYSD